MSLPLVSVLSCCCLAAVAAAADGHDDHGHDDHGHEDHGSAVSEVFEWAGIFEVPNAMYMWTSQKVDNKYADKTMKIAALPATAATKAALSALKAEGEHSLSMNCTLLEPAGIIIPKEDACYTLQFDDGLWQSLFTVNTSSVEHVAFFTEHVPTEFESTAHYLKDLNGADIEPVAEMPAEEEPKALWGESMAASIIVCLITLVGFLLAIPVMKRLADKNAAAFEGVLIAFAAGALIACAFFLLLFEATHLVTEGWGESEVDATWRWGTMALAGFILPPVTEGLVKLVLEARAQGEDDKVASTAAAARAITAVTIGDFLHNLCDGFFIGGAFKICGSSFGWTVSLATVLHEIPQELADYAILTGSSVGTTPVKAILVNFFAGTSVILGTIIINAADVSQGSIGLLLSFGGGTYIYLAAAECIPRINELKLSAKVHLACLLAFVVGTVLIGLILLDHEHCSAGGHGHGHGH